MRDILRVINHMVKDGVIDNYAIGGAVAAVYYLEPIDTADIDIFVQLSAPGSELMILEPIYEYLRQRGYQPKDEHVFIQGFPVQFLPVYDALTDEAVSQAQEVKVAKIRTRIMRPEHLVAIMLKTGRTKDYLRISMFLEQGGVNMRSLNAVLKRHDLIEKWRANEYRFKP